MSRIDEIDKYLTTRKAAELLGVSLRTVQLWVENGTLNAWKTAGGHRRILMNSVYQVLRQRKESVNKNSAEEVATLVLVEDDKDIRDAYSLSISLSGLPIKVIPAANGYDGLIQIGRHQPDIIVTDLMMPNMDGFEMIEAIKVDQKINKSDVIIVTALDKRSIEEEKIDTESITILHKPLRFEELEAVLLSKLEKKELLLIKSLKEEIKDDELV